MKTLILSIISLCAVSVTLAATVPVDSLEKQLQTANTDSMKAQLYNQLADRYMNYNAIQDKALKTDYQENAIKYTMSALHSYSRMDDSTGLRISYDRLARVYHDQKKFTQAKWFILQANTMAREQRDVPNIISSLVTLAQIKMDIKDYYLAVGDLQEAQSLAAMNCFADKQADVMLGYVRLYNGTHKYTLGKSAQRRYTQIKDSMKRDSQLRAARLQSKKKFYTVSNRAYNSSNRTISL